MPDPVREEIAWLRTVFEHIRDGKIADPALVAAAQVEGIDRLTARSRSEEANR